MRFDRVFGLWLKNELLRRKMLQKELARNIGVTEVSVSRWINGVRHPKLEQMMNLLRMMGYHLEIVKNEKP